ncbi:MAG: hypothetical protein DRI57_04380 [Deltaproteobacteria bacterium]|nr:MAG: hypothetical protein DRI57_04380 [Deltaproteobacteria bacterium]
MPGIRVCHPGRACACTGIRASLLIPRILSELRDICTDENPGRSGRQDGVQKWQPPGEISAFSFCQHFIKK